MKKIHFLYQVQILAILLLSSCSGDDENPAVKVDLTLQGSTAFVRQNYNQNLITVNWACLTLDNDSSSCIYYYNGVEQLDSNISFEALKAGPNFSNKISFVPDGTSYTDQDGDFKFYSSFSATLFKASGDVTEIPEFSQGDLDLRFVQDSVSSTDEKLHWLIIFGRTGPPVVEVKD